jgi:hypothetical protein
MADQYKDDPNLKTNAVRAANAIDASAGAVASVFQHATAGGKPLVMLAGTGAIILGSIGVDVLMYSNQDFPQQQVIPIDSDISGTGYMHRTYGYSEHEGGYYMLTLDEGLYQLYQWNSDRGRLEFIDNADVAKDLVSEIKADFEASIQANWYQNLEERSGSFHTDKMYRCTTLREPFEAADDIIVRYNGCTKLEGSGPFLHSKYPEALEFWAAAEEAMSAENYGHGTMTIHEYEAVDTDHLHDLGEYALPTAATGFAAWLALGALGAGVTGIRRRAEKDKLRALENARSRSTGRRP